MSWSWPGMALATARVLLLTLTLILTPSLFFWIENGGSHSYSKKVILEDNHDEKPPGFMLHSETPIQNKSDYRWHPVKESESQAYGSYKQRVRTTTPKPNLDFSAPVNCSLLRKENKNEVERVERKISLERLQYQIPTDSDIMNHTRDCKAYISNMGYIMDPLSQEEEKFPLAYGIRMHYNSVQAERLLRALYRPQHIFCISIDKKSSHSVHEAMSSIAKCFPNVFVVTSSTNFVYQSFSPVESDLHCMKEILKRSTTWKYFLNMAGMEFPLKTNLEMVRVLKHLNGSNDVEQYPFAKHNMERIRWKHIFQGSLWKPTRIPKEPFTGGNITVLKGCSYNSFSREFVQWFLKDPVAQKFINWTKDVHSPDEVVWASLNADPRAPGGYNSMVTQTAKTFLSREIIWHTSAGYCHGENMIRGVCILSVGNLGWLHRRWEFIANKFDIRYDHVIMDCLEAELKWRTYNPDPDAYIQWEGVWRALDNHKNLSDTSLNNVHVYARKVS